jgi:hypothetical protein
MGGGGGVSVSTVRAACPSFGLGRCDRRHKLLFEYPIIFWTPRGSLTAMAAAHPARGGIPHNTGAGMVRSWPPPLGLAA